MRQIIKKIGMNITIGLAFIGFMILFGVALSSTFNVYILGIGILLIFPILLFMYFEGRVKGVDNVRRLSDLKITGTRIPVDLNKCKVLVNSWQVQKEKNSDKEIVYNELIGDPFENRNTNDCSLLRLKYVTTVDGKRRTFTSPSISKDEMTVKMYLAMQVETSIYIDKDNPKYYYFDLEFITK